jgi:nitrite reductase/ring-hydroxylating ferredoxin subunit
VSDIQFEIGKKPYSAYLMAKAAVPNDEEVLVRVGPGTPCGELMRRYWQPVAMSSMVAERPRAARILGEDLVVFRDLAGRHGVLNKACSHRGASLEFGRVTTQGIQCCYHGWHYDVDGTVLETPGDPPRSNLREKICHGAYPAIERHGLVFAYMGPPEHKPPFPNFDTLNLPEVELVPYAIHHPCNWLQVHENLMDPVHAVFLHSKMGNVQFTPDWGEEPVTEWGQIDERVCFYVATRRLGDKVWVRFNEVLPPNFGQVGGFWANGEKESLFSRVGATRWTVPGDDTSCWIFGLRHFSAELEHGGAGNKDLVGYESLDLYGQTSGRTPEQMQRNPGDWEVEVSQGAIARHSAENLGLSDQGVVALRASLRRAVKAVENGQVPPLQATGSDGATTPTYTSNTVLAFSAPKGADDTELRRRIGRFVVSEVVKADEYEPATRTEQLRRALAAIPSRVLAGELPKTPGRFISL